jgi:hypothetical protein
MSITNILTKLTEKIAAAILADHGIGVAIELANISTLSENGAESRSAIILSIVNIEEDKTLKNQNLYQPHNNSHVARYKKAPQNLIVSVLFTSFNKDNKSYGDGLNKLEFIVRYLQSNTVFYYGDTGFFEQTEAPPASASSLNKLIIDMVSMKPEQLNQMWSYLGNKYMPSILYSIKLILIQNEDRKLDPDRKVDKVEIGLWASPIEMNAKPLESGVFTKQ